MTGKASGDAYHIDSSHGPEVVRLLYSTPEPERATAVAARSCYAHLGGSVLMGEMSREDIRRVLKTIIDSGHFAALEHASYTFSIEGVSRAMTHQLVRHRLASYNQQSQRYVVNQIDDKGYFEHVVPRSIVETTGALIKYENLMVEIAKIYQEFLKSGVPAEDARYILPNAATSKIVVTMNIRELLHFFELRCCKRAQWEIRSIADHMLDLALTTAPYIFMDAGASCRRGACREGKMSCGNPFPRAALRP